MHCISGSASSRSTPTRGPVPAAMTSAVPPTGSHAADPGKGVASEKTSALTAMQARPSQAMIPASRRGSCAS